MNLIRVLKYMSKKEAGFSLMCFAFLVCQTWLEITLPDYMSTITNTIETEGATLSEVIKPGLMMLLCALGSLICSIIVGFFAAKVAAGLSMRLREAVYDKVMSFSMEEIGRFSTPSLITRSTNDITQVMMLISALLKAVIRVPVLATWAIAKIAGKGWQWSTVTAVAVAVMVSLVIILLLITKPKYFRVQTLTDDMNRVTRENLSGIRVVHAYNAEDYQKKKFEKVNDDLTSTNLFTQRVMAFLTPGITLVMSLLTLAIYWVGMYIINAAAITDKLPLFSDMVVFYSYAMQIVMAFLILAVMMLLLPRSMVSTKRIVEVLSVSPSLLDGDITGHDQQEKGSIEFKNVSFTYPGAVNPILENISFVAKPGETVAVIGSTGSGKTTLINLIPRFYDVTSGEILVDGINVKEYKQSALRAKLGYVSQKSVLFSGTVKSNVVFGENPRPGMDEVVRDAVRVAQADEFVERMEGMYDAKIAQGGTNVSGGQRQRLSIARAICRNPEIYIFDDSFSALDYKTDRVLRRALKEKTGDATIMIVAQRIGTIKDADQILVLDKGRVVGTGRHEELLKSCEVYREIAESQLSKEELGYA